MTEVYTNIPRAYTAFSEWMMCVLYISLFPKRWNRTITSLICVLFLSVQITFLVLTEQIVIYLWIPVMAIAIGIMFVFILSCTEGNLVLAGYNCTKAFLAAEFAASLEWQLDCFFREVSDIEHILIELAMLCIVYSGIFVVIFQIEKKMKTYKYCGQITMQETIAVVFIAVLAFIFSNLSFVFANTPFSAKNIADIFNIRTLGDFCGLVILYAFQIKICEYMVEKELTAIQFLHKKQYDQYRYYQNSIEMIHIKYHDLKHQIAGLRGEKDEKKREEWLNHLEQELDENRLINQTGNQVLDTILAAKFLQTQKYNISITCVVDGKLLSTMHVADICTIFGNALDNAIESVVTLDEPAKRLIHLTLINQKGFVLINVSNYIADKIVIENGKLPKSSKSDKENHGYGLKSIQKTVEKYKGSMSIQTKENWFELRILLPKID